MAKATRKQVPCITCPNCQGKGAVELNDKLAATLGAFKGKVRLTAADLLPLFPGISVNAISNRLATLKELGFVTSVREGKCIRYQKAAEPPTVQAVAA